MIALYIPLNLPPAIRASEEFHRTAYFLDLVHRKWARWEEKWEAKERDGFVRLKNAYIRKIIPSEPWKTVSGSLMDRGIIGVTPGWQEGKRSKGYRLLPPYRRAERIEIDNPKLERRIRKAYTNRLLPVHWWVMKHLDRLEFDTARAETIVGTLYPDANSKMTLGEYRELVFEIVKRFSDGYLKVCRYGRVHTPVTSLPKELRCCLSIDGQPLVNLDIANSQPMIAGIVAGQFTTSPSAAKRLRQRTFAEGSHPYRGRKPQPITGPLPQDLVEYISVCESGELYESFGGDREKIKRALLMAFYDKQRPSMSAEAKELLRLYPTVMKMLRSLKRGKYQHAARVMQNLEATIMIQGVCTRLRHQNPEVPAVTIHDSIMTTRENVGAVKTAIATEFRKLGITPTIREE